MNTNSKGPKKDSVKQMREFVGNLREETLENAKKKAALLRKPKKNEKAASPRVAKRRDLDL